MSNIDFKRRLRGMVEADLRKDPQARTITPNEWPGVIDDVSLHVWAHQLWHGDPDAKCLLLEPRGPFVPDYWADRVWPPSDPTTVEKDFDGWCYQQILLLDGGY